MVLILRKDDHVHAVAAWDRRRGVTLVAKSIVPERTGDRKKKARVLVPSPAMECFCLNFNRKCTEPPRKMQATRVDHILVQFSLRANKRLNDCVEF